MELDRIAVVMRQRTPWEAVDLGMVMARHWWWQVFLIWALPAGAALVLFSLLLYRHVWLAPLLVWWLKPLWDRGAIYVASRRLFGEPVSLAGTLRNLPALYRRDLLASLTWRRFSLTRSFDLPVTLLEGLTGQARSARLAVLHPQSAGAATGLTLICVHIESFFAMAFYTLLYLFIPSELDPGLAAYTQWVGDTDYLGNALAFTTFCLVGPFYAVAGFALYISRRVELEAWDVELRFRHLAARARRLSLAGGAATLVLMLALAGSWPSAPALADEAMESPPAELSPHQLEVIEILSEPPFRRLEDTRGWRFKEPEHEDEEPEWWLRVEAFFQALARWRDSLGQLLQNPLKLLVSLLWLLFGGVVVWFLLRYRSAIRALVFTPSHTPTAATPTVMFGLDVSRESLPDDIPASVRKLWREAQTRQAASLLYRAFLSRLIHERGFAFSDGHTEGECLAIIGRAGDTALRDYAQRLTHLWQRLAYGGTSPDGAELEALCAQWDGVFTRAQ